MEGEFRAVIRNKVVDGLGAAVPGFTRRDVHVPAVEGKVMAVIGMRRSGKTTFLWQCLAQRLQEGTPREALLYFNFEDERLEGMSASGLRWVVEEYFAVHPQWRDRRRVTFFLDEIQAVPRWESFVRRLLDSEKMDLFVSGSSARLLSREVATSMRGRAMEVLVHPFSFREVLRHRGAEPTRSFDRLPKAERSLVDRHFRDYLREGGFPEAQGISARDRTALMRTYVDVALLRDVIERHGVTNVAALRWLVRHLMGNPASSFSVEKFYRALRSQGLAVGKNTLHEYLAHLEDAFLVRTVWLHTASERQRMVNPRKAYPADPGLIPVYERHGRANVGRALETLVLLELERRGCEVGWVRTEEGYEVDFYARDPEGNVSLLQAAAEVESADTWAREVRALASAARAHPEATPILVTGSSLPPQKPLPAPLIWQPAISWLLGDPPPEDVRRH